MQDTSLQKITVMSVQLPELRLSSFDIPKLRGSVANQYRNFDLLHNHMEQDKVLYRYPQIQFKTINKIPTMIGILEGCNVLKDLFFELEQININGKDFPISQKSIDTLTDCPLGQTLELYTYRFIQPWMALNQNNHKKYQNLPSPMRNQFLAKILRGNLMSLSKGFNYFIPKMNELETYVDLKPAPRNFKNNRMLCFTGTFTTNFLIPKYLGIGKQVSRGFGTVRRID